MTPHRTEDETVEPPTVVRLSLGACEDVILTASHGAGALAAALPPAAHGLHELRFGGLHADAAWPVTTLQPPADHGPFASRQLFAVAGVTPTPIFDDGRLCGWWYEDDLARYVALGGIAADPSLPREAQAARVFARIESLVQSAGLAFHDVARTWFYLDRLFEWYDVFNQVRTAFFRERGIKVGRLPASTGIGAVNHAGAALVAHALAIRPKDDRLRVEEVFSPLQCPASEYGSSFSRAVEIAGPAQRRLLVSGTASIEPAGASVHLGDTHRQTAYTLAVVELLMQSRGYEWKDVYRAIAYFKDAADFGVLDRVRAERGIHAFPVSYAHTDICREDLLFEIELDAAKT